MKTTARLEKIFLQVELEEEEFNQNLTNTYSYNFLYDDKFCFFRRKNSPAKLHRKCISELEPGLLQCETPTFFSLPALGEQFIKFKGQYFWLPFRRHNRIKCAK